MNWLSKNRLALVGTLLLVSVFLNLWFHGGLANTPEVGPHFREAAQREAPLTWTYMLGGDLLTQVGYFRDSGIEWARAAYGPGFPEVIALPATALDVYARENFGSGQRFVGFNYWASPVLLVLYLLLWWRRPKVLHTMGGRR